MAKSKKKKKTKKKTKAQKKPKKRNGKFGTTKVPPPQVKDIPNGIKLPPPPKPKPVKIKLMARKPSILKNGITGVKKSRKKVGKKAKSLKKISLSKPKFKIGFPKIIKKYGRRLKKRLTPKKKSKHLKKVAKKTVKIKKKVKKKVMPPPRKKKRKKPKGRPKKLKVGDVSGAYLGDYVSVKGKPILTRDFPDDDLGYRLEDKTGDIIVLSRKKLKPGRQTIRGVVKRKFGVLYIRI